MFNYHCLNPWISQACLPIALYRINQALFVTSLASVSPKCILVTTAQEMCSHFWSGGRHDRDNAGCQAETVVSGPFSCGHCLLSVASAIIRLPVSGEMRGPWQDVLQLALGHWQHLLLQPHFLSCEDSSQQTWPWHLHPFIWHRGVPVSELPPAILLFPSAHQDFQRTEVWCHKETVDSAPSRRESKRQFHEGVLRNHFWMPCIETHVSNPCTEEAEAGG